MNKKILLVICAIALVAVVLFSLRSTDTGSSSKSIALNGEPSLVDRPSLSSKRAEALSRKRGGRPLALALSKASSEPQKRRIMDRLSYQSQTREDALERATKQRDDIAELISANPEGAEAEELIRKQSALDDILSRLK